MLVKLSLLFGALFAAAEVAEPIEFHEEAEFHDDIDDLDNEDAEDFGDESLDAALDALLSPNGDNAETIAELKKIISSRDESEEAMAKIQMLLQELLGEHGDSAFEDEDADL